MFSSAFEFLSVPMMDSSSDRPGVVLVAEAHLKPLNIHLRRPSSAAWIFSRRGLTPALRKPSISTFAAAEPSRMGGLSSGRERYAAPFEQ
jgi:hypothetical protein